MNTPVDYYIQVEKFGYWSSNRRLVNGVWITSRNKKQISMGPPSKIKWT